jgi:predicted CXXCH cytochrome family protein
MVDAVEFYDYRACEACHPQEYASYQEGVHAEALSNPESIVLDADAPTCGHCHDPHYVSSRTRADLLAYVGAVCGECHADALRTYEHNYHGKAALLGHEETATCSDCHGAHTVLALYDGVESLPACQRCHPDATTRLVGYRIHAEETLTPAEDDPRAQDFKLFFWVKLFFTVLVVSVLAFFYTHTALWFLRSLHERLRRGRHG